MPDRKFDVALVISMLRWINIHGVGVEDRLARPANTNHPPVNLITPIIVQL